ncbi:Gluconate 2-dehydrogenase subunit 3 [Colwellia chukchiensis]|uniref:Gluconate 2-dehydrogenase subunit 3 n=1 Tax=Colwellia chukchiensis TaxID=641665 RepID=A0A1H7PZQ6_9GAMM|nr:gluconate 2-dehydrogenase subunit 3 family protein [Colwellia chukchiensis]SEL41039.1 Gluconate 2-dehydrogenase subunit 3 [Colwellia chukchiensis]
MTLAPNTNAFMNGSFITPQWLKTKLSRRKLLKSAAGATMVAAMPRQSWSATLEGKFQTAMQSNPWLTLDSVLKHLLPVSATGPSAEDIKATQYLFNVVYQQPTDAAETAFIYQGVGWLNGFTQSQKHKDFVELAITEKEQMLKAISQSRAGENWLSNLVGYIFEAMLTPPSYGGNPNGIGWQWLEHQAGFPLPPIGKRYYELPGQTTSTLGDKKTSKQSDATAVLSHQQYTRKQTGTRKA